MLCFYLIAAVILPSVLTDDCPCWDMDEVELAEHCEQFVTGSKPIDACAENAVVEYDSCACCQRCTRVENEVCGGTNDLFGACSPGLKCSFSLGNFVFGLCVEDTDEDAIFAQTFSTAMFPIDFSAENGENGLNHIFL
ncbi:uncharacterized protein [Antedon mediterranea]|uniref:uncharacterized protein n=1 Tax=Antedon mediterranea TaxID=105859 RepID=UPI003AF73D36